MPASIPSFACLAPIVALLAGCGARSDLQPSAGTDAEPAAPSCPRWSATHAPVQVSTTPSLIDPQSALATPSGVLVGYAEALSPPVDPTWHARLVGFGDGALGAEQTVFHHDTSGFIWSRISIAQGSGHTAATASDEGQGILFVPMDDTGAPQTAPVHLGADLAHYLLPTSSGYTVLRNPVDPTNALVPPISLVTLDLAGAILATQLLVDASAPIVWFERLPLAAGDFMLVWDETSTCDECYAVRAQRFDESGAPRAPAATLRSFGAMDYGNWIAATSPSGAMLVWTEGSSGPVKIVARPFDADGNPAGPAQTFAHLPGPNPPVLALAAAPGGDFVVAWADDGGGETAPGDLVVQSIGPHGAAEGPPTMLGKIGYVSDQSLLLVASPLGAMVLYADNAPHDGIDVFAVPLACSP